MSCPKCRASLCDEANTCPECGYRGSKEIVNALPQTAVDAQSSLKVYTLIKLLGGAIAAAGLAITFAGAPANVLGASLPVEPMTLIIIGAAIYLTGLLGAWWNTGD